MSDGRVIIDTRLDPKGAVIGLKDMNKTVHKQTESMKDDISSVQTKVDSVTSSIGNMGNVIKKVGILLASAFTISKLIQIGKQAIEIASDVQEVQNVVDTAFGDMAYKMEQFADVAIETYGISKLTAKQTGSTMMAMAKGLGLASDEASDMAINLTGLSADMASFYNISQDMASTALKSIFTGETETLKRFGIVMTEANLSAFALSQGINKSLKNMTQAEKVQLRYAYVMQQTSLAQGDFAKTSDSWANQTRILSERWKEFLSIAGNGLIQLLTPALKVINELMQQLIVGITTLANYFGFAFEATATAGISDMESAMDDYTESTNAAVKAQKALLGGYDKLQVISSDTGSGGGSGASTQYGGTSVQPIEVNKNDVNKTFKIFDIIKDRFGSFISDIESIKDALSDVFNSSILPMMSSFVSNFLMLFDSWKNTTATIVSSLWNDSVYPSLMNFITYGIPIIATFYTEMMDILTVFYTALSDLTASVWQDAISPILKVITNAVEDMWIILTKWVDDYGVPILDNIEEGVGKIATIIQNLWDNWLGPIAKNIASALDELWTNHFKNFFGQLVSLIGSVITLATLFINKFVMPIVSVLVDKFGATFNTVFNTVLNIVKVTVGRIIDIVASIIGVFRNVIDFIKNVFTGQWRNALNSLKNIVSIVFDGIVNIFKSIVNRIIGFMNAMIQAVQNMINFVINCVNKLSFDVPDWVPGIGGEHFGFKISKVSLTQIPYLAQGAVLPANNPFLAVVGDQKHGTNIEAPLDTIVKAFEQVMNNRSNDSGDIILNIDGNELFRWTRKKNAEYRAKYGVSAF